jgi:radical SAM protein with 4Fe4S-binding SPASM domain
MGKEISSPDMEFENYKNIIKQCKGKVFQVALGGRGDPDCHNDFEAILYETRLNDVVPNITTSGFLFNPGKAKIIAQHCGAAAVSWYRTEYTYSAIEMLLAEGVTTNIHFILSEKSIAYAVEAMEKGLFPKGIKAVIFLLYKPVGYNMEELILKKNNKYLQPFFDLMNNNKQPYMLGFDSCLAPGVLINCKNAAPECIEPCESARYSAYISSDMRMYPCSFIQKAQYVVDLSKHSIAEAWKSEAFEVFRRKFRAACPYCDKRELCLGGCPDIGEINLCNYR